MSSTFNGEETAPFFGFGFGFLGTAAALIFSCMGVTYGIANRGGGVSCMGVMRSLLAKILILPFVGAVILGVYLLIDDVIITTVKNPEAEPNFLFSRVAHLYSIISCCLSGLASVMIPWIFRNAGESSNARKLKLLVALAMIIILVFVDALAVYGLLGDVLSYFRA